MTQYCLDCNQFVIIKYDPIEGKKIVGPENYCLECSSHYVAEYDPTEVVAKYSWNEVVAKFPPQPTISDISAVLNTVMTNIQKTQNYETKKFTDFIYRYNGDILNVSAIFMLRRARITVTEENKRMAHRIIRETQMRALGVSEADLTRFGAENMSASIIKGIKTFDKDLFNLSPIWTLRQARIKTQRVADLMQAIYSLDLILRAKKQL